ncbi:NUDIX domain-containing protein [Halosimplex aquaticum]|uniref:NUDIX domain-containing protein n=1 Tax=Halosimplex aquaticum TaxID=3026162 RepID=A0ABD5XXX5_9EURY|nr:NUDIX domain-containing protein [Halosimplex aquaticum]
MSVAEGSRDRVEARLVALEEDYSGFPVNQTTLAVPREAYERAGERCQRGIVDAYVQLYNERDDVLLVENDGEWVVPHGEPRTDERVVAGTERAISERTGIDCALTDLSRVTILGVRDESDPERPPIYRLIAVFTAETLDEGSPAAEEAPAAGEMAAADGGGDAAVERETVVADGVRWHPTLPDSAVPPH